MARRRARGMRNWPLVAAIAATVACAAAYAGHGRGYSLPGLDDLERRTIDLRFRTRGPRPIRDNNIVIIGLDDETRRVAPDVFQTRRGWARLITALAQHQPRAIALDLFFSSPEQLLPGTLGDEVRAAAAATAAAVDAAGPAPPDPAPADPEPADPRPADPATAPPALPPALIEAREVLGKVAEALRGDEVLARAVADAKVVYLGAAFLLIERADQRPARPPTLPPGLDKGEVTEAVGGAPGAPSAYWVATTIPSIAAGAVGAGAVNHYRDPDGVARRMPLVIEMGGHYVASLGLALAGLATDQPTRYVAASRAVSLGDRDIPARDATVRLNYLGRAFPRVSAARVLDGTVPEGALTDKILLVGMTYAAYDKVPTPYDPLTDGVELHATLLHNLLYDGVLRDAGRWVGLAAVLALGAIASLLQLRTVRRRSWLPIVIAVATLLVWGLLVQLAFERRGVVVDLMAPAATLVVAMVVATAATMATEGREKARLRSAFGQYVSKTLVERIVANPSTARLGGERRELTVLFSDIRGFSRLAESLPPERLAEFLNQYLTPMTDLVLDSDGTLDKYIGDAVMAVWNAPVDVDDHAARACGTALAMLESLAALNQRWPAEDLPSIAIGIGINTGTMAVGNMGSEARFDYTVLGDAVNLASRLEGLTKQYQVDVLCGEATRSAAVGFVFRELDWVRVVGKDQVGTIYQLVGRTGEVELTGEDLSRWDRMLDAYRAADFLTAEVELKEFVARHPDDGPARVFTTRIRELAAAPPPPDWNGVYDPLTK